MSLRVSTKSTKSLLASARRLLVDALFPERCYGCKVGETYLCDTCINYYLLPHSICPHCHARIPFGKLPEKCKRKIGLDVLLTCSNYKDDAIASIVKDLKYKHAHFLAHSLANISYTWMRKQKLLPYIKSKGAVIVPVPGHIKKVKERGFDPPVKISEYLSDYSGIPIYRDVLIKSRPTKAQVETLSKKERERNIRGSFAIKNKKELQGKTIILVDDVITTGSTMKECAKTLRRGQVDTIIGLAVTKD